MEIISQYQGPKSLKVNLFPAHLGLMTPAWAKRLSDHFQRKGWTQAYLAERSGVSYDSVRKYLTGAVKQPRGDTLNQLADALGIEYLWLKEGIGPEQAGYPLIGFVSAGEAFTPYDDNALGAGHDYIDLRLDSTDGIAIEVRGTSMLPVYRPGDYLFCSRQRGLDIDQCIGSDCVVMTTDGDGYLKVLTRGARKDTFTLESYNRAYPPIEDVRLEWAAPVRLVRRG